MPAPSQHAFSEKVALVTDGTNPVGRAVALQLALYGSYVIVALPRNSTDAERRALTELKSLGTLAEFVEVDLCDRSGAVKLIAEVEKMYGRLDLLVNCLKFANDSEFAETSEAIFDETIGRNLKGTFFVLKEAMRLMKNRPKPKIVNVASQCDSEKTGGNLAFVAANAALNELTKRLAKNLPRNFRINGVAVSEKEKPGSKFDLMDEDLFPAQKAVNADDTARTILFLLSSEAIGINGRILQID